jgi:hypothetical protein
MIQVLRMEDTKHAKMEFYMAQIAAEVRRSYVKHPNKVKVSDMEVIVKDQESRDWRTKMAVSKAAYKAMLGPTLKRERN